MKTAPLLSIGMIFKNEARCLERCLQSLEPLRQAVPCELIMADTGAQDGSREIAQRYADEVFDFAWIDDFAAARNAVMERCTGKWYLTLDCDEWLDEDVSELTAFLKSRKMVNSAYVIQRNYFSQELDKGEVYHDFQAMRLIRMSTGQRYEGIIHEYWPSISPSYGLRHTILHHDGYFFTDPVAAEKKSRRNMELLRQTLKENPKDLRTLNQCIESCHEEDELLQYIRTGVELVREKSDFWQIYGGLILRNAINTAREKKLPELDEWVDLAQTLLPKSIFVQVDVNAGCFIAAYGEKKWKEAVRHGEDYCKGMKILHGTNLPTITEMELGKGVLQTANPLTEHTMLTGLASAYQKVGQGEKALQTVKKLSGKELNAEQVQNTAIVLCGLHALTKMDILPVMADFYAQISQNEPSEVKRAVRMAAFNKTASIRFTKEKRKEEQQDKSYWRPSCTLFSVLADQCELGRAGEMMSYTDPAQIESVFPKVEDWSALPIEALEHALLAGAAFPPTETPLNIEVLDGLASRLTQGDNPAKQIALALTDEQEYPDIQSLYWAQSLVLASLRAWDWSAAETNENQESTPQEGLALLRRFAQVEAKLLSWLYTAQALTEETVVLLPPMHRWGFYCKRAFDALDAGKPQEYLAILRKSLKACSGEKSMVQFLLDRFVEDTRPKASPELLALAERIRRILSAYAPDDPAVIAIRESPAYKQVAWIIETEPVGQMMQ